MRRATSNTSVRRPVMESPGCYRAMPSSSTPEMDIIKSEFTPSPHLLDHEYGATPQNQVISQMLLQQAPAVKRKLNMDHQHVIIPIKQEFKAPPPKKPKRASPVKKNTRYDTSLSLLTKKFKLLLENSPDGVVNLNKASEELQVQKRRIYDITNVLEGIDILEKKSKNRIQWKGGSKGCSSLTKLKKENCELEQQENHLDRLISLAETDLHRLSLNKQYAYITYHDLRSIPRYKNKTVMAIKAPPDSKLDVSRNTIDGYQIQMKSEAGEIEVFLCPENISPPKLKHVPPMDPLLHDIKLSPGIGIFNFTTPPVPLLDSPIAEYKPISSQLCRQLSFSKDVNKDPVLQSVGALQSARQSFNYISKPVALQQQTTDLTLSPEPMRAIFENISTMGSSTSLPSNNEMISKGLRIEHDLSFIKEEHSDIMDPMFCEPFVPLEPLSHSEYNFSLDSGEGLADLFDSLTYKY